MSTEPLPKTAQAEHLTDVLRRSGVLEDGRIRVVESSSTQFVSNIIRLRLTYDGAAIGPASLILKTGLPDRPSSGGKQEVAFYVQVASKMSGRFVPRCFEAFSDPDTSTWHLLLEDLNDSHFIAASWPLPPTIEQCDSIIVARARFHAEWWDDPRLGKSVGTWLDADAISSNYKGLLPKLRNLSISWVTYCHTNGAISLRDCSMPRPAYLRVTIHIATSRLFKVTRTFGITSCPVMVAMMSGSLVSRPATLDGTSVVGSLSCHADGVRGARL
jgi:hypothetical protein